MIAVPDVITEATVARNADIIDARKMLEMFFEICWWILRCFHSFQLFSFSLGKFQNFWEVLELMKYVFGY